MIKVEDIIRIREILEKDASNSDLMEMLCMCEASWKYEELSESEEILPHAELTSGKHSDAYYNMSKILRFPNLRKTLAQQMAMRLLIIGIKKEDVDVVVSSSYAALSIGQALAEELNALFVYTEKVDGKQKWTGRFEIPKGAKVLQVEELITTMGTTSNVREALIEALGDDVFEFINYKGKNLVVVLLHRPGEDCKRYDYYYVLSLVEEVVHVWEAEDCPLCKKGSVAMKPKSNPEIFFKGGKLKKLE